MTERCTPDEAREILGNTVKRPTAQSVARLQTLSDDDLTTLSQSPDTFAINESNRRLSIALRAEAAKVTRLTRWVIGLTWAVVVLTGFLVWETLCHR